MSKIPKSAVGVKQGSKAKVARRVQEYLEQFGYLGPERQDFETDEVFVRQSDDHLLEESAAPEAGVFDEPTTEALRLFQEHTGLEVTGEVDEATRAMMNTKRCGLPAVTSSVVGNAVTGVGKWSTNNLTYSFQNYTNDLSNDAIRWAIDQAFSLWSAETPLRFRRVADGTSGDIVIRFVTGRHGDGFPFDGRGNVAAHAFFPNNSNPIKGDAHFDDAEGWTVVVPRGSGNSDLVAFATHEFGHSLGLRHTTDRTAVMWDFPGDHGRFLSPDDIVGIQSLYGGPGRLENATWIHGNAALVEYPDRLDSQRYYGFFNRLIGKRNSTNWFHFALPTPVIEDRRRLSLDRFMLRATTGSRATLRDVHIRDGERLVARLNEVNRSGNLSFEKFGVASMPAVRWGVSVSLGFDFGTGSSSQRRVDLISGGVDYR